MSNVIVRNIKSDQVHLKFADISNGGTNIPLAEASAGKQVKLLPVYAMASINSLSCEGKFVPMQ
jgi:hypothetical protein